MGHTNSNKDRFIKRNFWISEFLILTLSNYYSRLENWNLPSIFVTLLIIIINIQYCMIHVKWLKERLVKWNHILFVETSYVLANVYIVLADIFWLDSSEINFGFVLILAVILCPMVVINSKYLNVQNLKENDDYTANVIYKAAIDEEKE